MENKSDLNTIKYSPSTGGFYVPEISYPSLPNDCIDISKQEYLDLVNRPSGSTLDVKDSKVVIVLPPEKSDEEKLKIAKDSAIANVIKTHAELLSKLTGSVTSEERDTWPEKVLAAKESIAVGSPTEDAKTLFKREASALGQTIIQRCQRSLQLRAAYLNLVGLASGLKTELEIVINAATTPEQVDAIMHQAKIQVDTEVKAFMALLGK